MSKTYQFEELDVATREYLITVRDRQGKGLPGIFVPGSTSKPLLGFIFGFLILAATVLITLPPTRQPHVEAMLQTAGFILGGWMVVAAVRVWMARSSGKNPGHFIYADPETLYEVKGSTVMVTDIYSLREARATQNFTDNAYKSTEIVLKLDQREKHYFLVHDEERGRRMTVFLNSVAFMRDGGEDGNNEQMRKLSPEVMGSVAKIVAKTGQFPRDLVADDLEVNQIPRPRKEHRAATGFLPIMITLLIGVGLYSFFTSVNEPFRDASVFNQIKSLPPKEQPPALRLYLANENFKSHRDEAQQMLDKAYETAAATKIHGKNPAFKEPFEKVFLSLKNKPVGVVSFQMVELEPAKGDEAAAAGRELNLRTELADKWGSTLGDELVVFASPQDPNTKDKVDQSVKGMIDIRWKFTTPTSMTYTIEFRYSVDDPEPFATLKDTFATGANSIEVSRNFVAMLLDSTIGMVVNRPPVINLDF